MIRAYMFWWHAKKFVKGMFIHDDPRDQRAINVLVIFWVVALAWIIIGRMINGG